jgi:hypothetical protein
MPTYGGVQQAHFFLRTVRLPLAGKRAPAWAVPDSLPLVKARFAEATPSGAIVFVHGFAGEATGTWNEFQSLLPLEAAAVSRDVFFFGYDSMRLRAPYNAAILRGFLESLFSEPEALVAAADYSLPVARGSFSYKHCLIIAHSLGAVVTRLAISELSSTAVGADYVERMGLVLFAPAHSGANIVELGSMFLTGVTSRLADVAEPFLRAKFKSLDDLEVGSDTLTYLKGATERAIASARQAGRPLGARAARCVVHADGDFVVSATPLCDDDAPLTPFFGCAHMSVCKPNGSFLEPLRVVLDHL